MADKITRITETDRNALKLKTAFSLPDSPAASGMKAAAVKRYFYAALVDGENSVAGLLCRAINEMNAALGKTVEDVRYDEERACIVICFGDGSERELPFAQGNGSGEGTPGKDGATIVSIEKTSSDGLVDTYTVQMSDGTKHFMTVTNGKDGVSPTVSVEEDSEGHVVTITDAEGVKSFTVKNGRDGADGADGDGSSSGGGEPCLKTTTLFDGYLGFLPMYSGTIFQCFEGIMADALQPNTPYLINGVSYTSDEEGNINDTNYETYYDSDGDPYIDYSITISGRTVVLNVMGSYDEQRGEGIQIPIKVVGLGTYTAILSGNTAYKYLDDNYTEFQLPKGHASTIFVTIGDITKPYLIKEDGTLDLIAYGGTSGATSRIKISAENWKLKIDTQQSRSAKALILVSIENHDAVQGGSSGGSSSGGGSEVILVGSGAHVTRDFDPGKTYMMKVTYGNANTFVLAYILHEGSLYAHSPYGSMADECYVSLDGGTSLAVSCYASSGALIEITELSAFEYISCFIEGTEVLLRDPETMEIYTKRIEDVLPFEYAAYWSPEKGRLTATRVLAPPIVGDCTEYDRLTFSNGTVLNVFGVQFFWNVDTDRLQNWSDMEPGTRVCTSEGDIITYVGSEHIVSEVPVKHYTLLTFMGRYMAGGIQVGDKRDLILPRLMKPERRRYWRMLNERDQASLRRAFAGGMDRRNRKHTKAYVEAKHGFAERRRALKEEQTAAERYLTDTDYQVIKLTEGVLSEEEFAPTRTMRADKRALVNRCRTDAVALDAEEKETLAAVEQQILDTYVPKRAGKFAGKTRAVLEEEKA